MIHGSRLQAFLRPALVTLLAVGTLMPSFNYESQTARTQVLSSFAEALVMFVAWFQFIMIVLVAPSLTSPAICEEKRMGTLSALMTSPLTSLQIVVGKLTGRMYQVVLLTLISAPMLLTVRVFGGVPAETVLAFTSVTLATALLGGAMGAYRVSHSCHLSKAGNIRKAQTSGKCHLDYIPRHSRTSC